jgi:ADP-heptose:LPS heptosyltransferase
MDFKKVKKILIMRPEHIGDYALSLRALFSIRNKFPKAKIDVVIGPWNAGLAKATPCINKSIIFEHPFVKRHIGYMGIIKALTLDLLKMKKFIGEINKESYDLYVNFSDRKYNLLFDRLIHAKFKLLGTKKKYLGGRDVERIENLLITSGIPLTSEKIKLEFSKKEKGSVDKFLKNNGLKRVLIHPITSLNEKDWPIKKWKMFIMSLLKNPDLDLILLGTSNERTKLESLGEALKHPRLTNLAGEINLTQLVYLLSKSNLIIGGDSGPVHLAEITGTPMLILFGPTDEIRWGPREGGGKIIKNNEIWKISVETVLKEIKGMY